jgi:hypothetical protein
MTITKRNPALCGAFLAMGPCWFKSAQGAGSGRVCVGLTLERPVDLVGTPLINRVRVGTSASGVTSR